MSLAAPLNEVILDFARPMLEAQGADGRPRYPVENALQVSIAIWNAVIIESLGYGDFIRLAQEEEGVLDDPRAREIFAGTIDALVTRKHADFAGDDRFVSEYEVTRSAEGGLTLVVQESQMPSVADSLDGAQWN